MSKIRIPVILSTLFLLIYSLAQGVGVSDFWIYAGFTLSPFIVVWLVFQVLLLGEPSGRKFDAGHWYDDYNINQVREQGSETKC